MSTGSFAARLQRWEGHSLLRWLLLVLNGKVTWTMLGVASRHRLLFPGFLSEIFRVFGEHRQAF